MRASLGLPATAAFMGFLQAQEQKFSEIDPDFWNAPALAQGSWRHHSQTNRHTMTRHAMRGFHHLICTNSVRHHQVDSETCICRLCGLQCSQYHLLACPSNSHSLSFWANQ